MTFPLGSLRCGGTFVGGGRTRREIGLTWCNMPARWWVRGGEDCIDSRVRKRLPETAVDRSARRRRWRYPIWVGDLSKKLQEKTHRQMACERSSLPVCVWCFASLMSFGRAVRDIDLITTAGMFFSQCRGDRFQGSKTMRRKTSVSAALLWSKSTTTLGGLQQ